MLVNCRQLMSKCELWCGGGCCVEWLGLGARTWVSFWLPEKDSCDLTSRPRAFAATLDSIGTYLIAAAKNMTKPVSHRAPFLAEMNKQPEPNAQHPQVRLKHHGNEIEFHNHSPHKILQRLTPTASSQFHQQLQVFA